MDEQEHLSEQMAHSVPDGEISVEQLPNGDATILSVEHSVIENNESQMEQPQLSHLDYHPHGGNGLQEENLESSTDHHNQIEHHPQEGEQQLPIEQGGELQPQSEAQQEPSAAPVTEEDRLWNIVKTNSADFNSWTLLISETEKVEDIIKIRKVYDSFLAEYPLCYGYWKKYADHEGRLGNSEKIAEVYERSVQAVTYSVDIWMHYSIYAISKFEDPDMIRSLFERGVAYVGTDYLSHLLWDKYIEFENSQNNISGVMQILTRILQIPIQQLDRYYASFKSMMTMHSLQELMTPEEIAASAVAAAAEVEVGVEQPPAEAVVAVGEEASKPEGWSDASSSSAYDKFVGVREAMYKAAKEQDAKIRDFESGIRRPYFHVKPLDNLQIDNWHRYVDFTEKEGKFDKIVKLYERCLIACANYPEYWIRYIQCMDRIGSVEYAMDALNRATQIFVKRRPEIHLFAARRYELLGDVNGARSEYDLLNSGLAVGLLESVIKFANFERRQGNLEKACSVFEAAIQIEKSKEDSSALPFLFIQYARFLDQIALNVDKARELLSSALEQSTLSKTLIEAAIQMEAFRSGVKAFDYLESLVRQAISLTRPDGSQGLSASDREDIASIFLEFVDLFGDAEAQKRTEEWYREFFPSWKMGGESKKRSLEGAGSDRVKVAKTNSTSAYSAQSAPQAYANGQSQWGGGGAYGPGGGYNQQSQAWQQPVAQQTPQGQQPQQWNVAAYSAQTAGYAGYGTYAPPQQQGQPQQPAYSGYPQSYAPQSYGASAPAYTAPQQQPASQQGYYGYY